MRIAVIDLNFYWPPVGGGRVDLRETLRRLARHHEVTLFVPQIRSLLPVVDVRGPLARTKFFLRGHVNEDLGFEIRPIEMNAIQFTPRYLVKRFSEALQRGRFERLLLGDGWYLKPYLVEPFTHLRPLVRLYAYEGLCTRAHGMYYRNGAPCDVDPLGGGRSAALTCIGCSTLFLACYPSPTFIHEFVMARAFLPSYRGLSRRALAAADRVLVYNEQIASLVRPFARRVDLVPSGADPGMWAAVRNPPPAPPLRLLVSGRLDDPAKGLAVARQAVAAVRSRGVPVELAFTAMASDEKPWERALGWTAHENLPAVFENCHAVLVPSRWPEPFGMVAVEAMAAGRPVIASRIGGLATIVEDGRTGFLTTAGDPESLATAIVRFWNERAAWPQMAAANREAARAYTWDAIYERTYATYF